MIEYILHYAYALANVNDTRMIDFAVAAFMISVLLFRVWFGLGALALSAAQSGG